jgi:hypothetical protein
MSETVTLSAEFEIQIPETLCAERGWKAGQVLTLMPKGSGILLMPVPERGALAGIAEAKSTHGYRDRTDRT